ncbi:MAG: GNAT family N-acetyltransferase [Pseudobdellovibrionaceae bacterium]|jgi:RimJ/RimL family protein N-acetyltransferase
MQVQNLDLEPFIENAFTFLAIHPAMNSLMMGLAESVKQGVGGPSEQMIVRQNEEIQICTFATPPHNLILSHGELCAIPFLVKHLSQSPRNFKGVVGPKDLSHAFAHEWTSKTQDRISGVFEQMIFELIQVIPPRESEGESVAMKPEHLSLIESWYKAFVDEALPHEPITQEQARLASERLLERRTLRYWMVDNEPKSMAVFSRRSQFGVSIGAVYTPPQERGRGYASNLVAAMSQEALDSGKPALFLYTDLRNPVSNAIYQKIGYRPIGASSHILFK